MTCYAWHCLSLSIHAAVAISEKNIFEVSAHSLEEKMVLCLLSKNQSIQLGIVKSEIDYVVNHGGLLHTY